MSKIFSAVQRSGGGILDFSQRLQALGCENLFPPLSKVQAREFEHLANSLLGFHDNQGGQVVVFTSTYPDEGASFVSYNCARSMAALLDKKFAWIDGNFQNPMNQVKDRGLNLRDLLENPALLAELDDGPGFVTIPNGTRPVKIMDRLNGPQYAHLLDGLRRKFYFTFIDTSSILQGLEVLSLAQQSLGCVLVVQSKRLKYEVIHHGIEKLRENNIRILGTVLNKRTFQLPDFFYKRF